MRTVFRIKRGFLVSCSITLLVLALVLTACGTNTSNSGGSTTVSHAGSTPSPVNGYGAAYGCPSNEVVGSTPPAATHILQTKDANSTITISTGATIEVRLPFGQKWQGPTSTQNTLTEQQPAGYAAKDVNSCVWRFTATKVGTAQLEFNGMTICNDHTKACPMYIMVMPFTIKVQ